jgi:hypothetical protein
MEAARLADPPRARAPEPRRHRDDGSGATLLEHLELVPLVDRTLVDVATEDQLDAGGSKRVQEVPTARNRPLVRRAPGRVREMLVQDRDAQRAFFCPVERSPRTLQLLRPDGSALVPERAGGVQPDDMEPGQGGDGLGRLPDVLELRPGPEEPPWRVREVVVSGHGKDRRPEPAEESRRALELPAASAMGEIARRDDELRLVPLDEPRKRRRHVEVLVRPDVEVGYVEEACCHGRTRL